MPQNFKPVTVGISGGSASGKTTLTTILAEGLKEFSPVVLHQDYYFRDWSEYLPEERGRVITANHPDAVRWEALLGHIRQLIARQPIETPPEGTRAFARGDAPATIQPSDLIVVEGHLILWDAGLRDLMDVKLFVDVEPHERVLRRLLRDVAQRGGDLEGAVAWYRRDVIPNFSVYTEPCKAYADLVVPFLDENPVALQTLVAGLRDRIVNQRTSVKLEM